MRPECENLRPRRKIWFGKKQASPRREMQTHHTAATCCLRLGAATIMLPARWIVNVGTRLTGWNSVGRLTLCVYALPHETHSGADARAKISISNAFLRKRSEEHTSEL